LERADALAWEVAEWGEFFATTAAAARVIQEEVGEGKRQRSWGCGCGCGEEGGWWRWW
jgi:hypothetical protein